ncbi:MAG: plastocyanin/azurin family copper-binding protein [Acidobacteriota bacterium]
MIRAWSTLLAALLLAGDGVLPAAGRHATMQDGPPPRILLDQSPRAVEYQLNRLSDAQLARVERDPSDPRFVPVYRAILRRPGLQATLHDEALQALVGLERQPAARVLLDVIAATTDAAASEPLLRRLAAMPAAALGEAGAAAVDLLAAVDADSPAARAAYVVLVGGAGGAPELQDVWTTAGARDGQRVALLDALALLPAATARERAVAAFAPDVRRLAGDADDARVQAAAVRALAALQPDRETFATLAGIAATAPGVDVMAAVVDAAAHVPQDEWSTPHVEPLARALVAWLGRLDAARRTEPPAVDAIALAERLVAAGPPAAAALRGELRALGVRVIRLEAVFEQVAFDRRWFVVEAGRDVQIVFFNPDAMPHNVVIGVPGSLEKLGTEGGAMPMPDDPAVRPFVPDAPEVIAATHLINQGQTARLSFRAPDTPGDYVFVCTFPGHWVRMYGVMKVVDDLAAWEADPVPPVDPMTGQPFS